MEPVNLNHAQFLTSKSASNPGQTSTHSAETLVGTSKSSVSPSTVVNISDDGYAFSIQESLKGTSITFIEKSEEEYRAMSFEDLVNERDGKGKFRADGDTTIYEMNSYGKAAQEVLHRVREQQMENTRNAGNLAEALSQFRAKVIEAHPGLKPSDIDVEVKDGKLSILASGLTESQKVFAQKLLESSHSEAINLKGSIAQFNEGGLRMINMMIYDERGHYSGENSEGKAVRHREEFVTMDEFVGGARYGSVAASNGAYTWNKFNDLVGSSKWGTGLVYEE